MVIIEIANEQSEQEIDATRLQRAVQVVLNEAGIKSGEISIAIVSDAQMHLLNRKYLDHDYPTDVLSFVLEHDGDHLEGEIIVSADYAAREAARYGWTSGDELLLYAIHGALHLVGYDDLDPVAKQQMRQRERHHLAQHGLTPRYDERDETR